MAKTKVKDFGLPYDELKAELRNLRYKWEDLAKKYCKSAKKKEYWFEVHTVLMDAESGIDEVLWELGDE